jgi:hypothetical protein
VAPKWAQGLLDTGRSLSGQVVFNLKYEVEMRARRRNHSDGSVIAAILFMFGAPLLVVAGWLTHVIVAIQAQAWIFMIVGALIVPVAVVHGWSEWLGFDWLSK